MIAPILAAAAALFGSYLLLRRWLRRRKSPKEEEMEALAQAIRIALRSDKSSEGAAEAVTGTSAVIAGIVTRVEATSAYVHISQIEIGREYVDALVPTDTLDVQKMQGMNDLRNILPSQYALEDDIFDARVVTNDLLKHQFKDARPIYEERREIPKKTFVVVQDISSSMEQSYRTVWSLGINIALVDKAYRNGIDYILITFNGAVQSCDHAHSGNASEYDTVARKLLELIGANGGTDISLALNYAIDYVSGLKPKPEEYASEEPERINSAHDFEMVLITDGTEMVNSEALLARMKENQVKLHTICVGVENPALIGISAKYDFIRDVT